MYMVYCSISSGCNNNTRLLAYFPLLVGLHVNTWVAAIVDLLEACCGEMTLKQALDQLAINV